MLFYILMEKIPLDTISGLNHAFDLYHSSADKVIGLIQISHGMAEHKVRYLSLINFLNQHGYHVAIYDHKGMVTESLIIRLDSLISLLVGSWLLWIYLKFIRNK